MINLELFQSSHRLLIHLSRDQLWINIIESLGQQVLQQLNPNIQITHTNNIVTSQHFTPILGHHDTIRRNIVIQLILKQHFCSFIVKHS
ncbi:hypothetical protein D3C80_1711750 [compost metagenome]